MFYKLNVRLVWATGRYWDLMAVAFGVALGLAFAWTVAEGAAALATWRKVLGLFGWFLGKWR